MNARAALILISTLAALGCAPTDDDPIDEGSSSSSSSTTSSSSGEGPLDTTSADESSSDGAPSTDSSDSSGESTTGDACEPTETYAAHWPIGHECYGACGPDDFELGVSSEGLALSMCSPTCSIASDCPPHPLGDVACIMDNRCALPCDDGVCPDAHECFLLGGGFPTCIPFAL